MKKIASVIITMLSLACMQAFAQKTEDWGALELELTTSYSQGTFSPGINGSLSDTSCLPGKPEYIWTGEAAAVIFLRRPILSWFPEVCLGMPGNGLPSFRKSDLAWGRRRTVPETGNTILPQPYQLH